jgi:hypothetical protein
VKDFICIFLVAFSANIIVKHILNINNYFVFVGFAGLVTFAVLVGFTLFGATTQVSDFIFSSALMFLMIIAFSTFNHSISLTFHSTCFSKLEI